MNAITKQRFAYIDIAKGLGILMVVWGHVVPHWTSAFVYTFHMPLFFFISGMLFNRSKHYSFGDFLKARARRLIVPYLWYSVVTWGLWAAFSYFRRMSMMEIITPLCQILLAKGSGQFFVFNSPLWFIPCLFAVEIMYFLISRFTCLINLLICICLTIISVLLEHFYGEQYLLLLPWNLDAAFMALPIYAAGNLLVKRKPFAQIYHLVDKHLIAAIAIAVLCAVVVYMSLGVFPNISMGYSCYGNECVFHIRALIGITIVIIISVLLEVFLKQNSLRNFMEWCGKNSLDIMCTHIPIKGVLALVAAECLNSLQFGTPTESRLLIAILVFALTVLFDTLIVLFINKYMKRTEWRIY